MSAVLQREIGEYRVYESKLSVIFFSFLSKVEITVSFYVNTLKVAILLEINHSVCLQLDRAFSCVTFTQ